MTDSAWRRIEPLLPAADGRGRPQRDHRQVIDGILWRLLTGVPWSFPGAGTISPTAGAGPAQG
ncbi:transposase [Sinosporangium album]|uniref:transposase n=1 Tax=Sinosporangium album TaxID=504805 RepID=UPI001C409E3C